MLVRRTAAAAGASGLLLLAAPAPLAAARALREAGSAVDPTAPLVALLALAAWALAAWLLLAVALTAGGHLPGLAGRALAALGRAVAPAAVRRGVELALGLTVAVGALGPGPAAAGGPTAGSAAGPAAEAPATPPAPDLDWAAAPPPVRAAAPASRSGAPAPGSASLVVQPGDTLWGLAEQDLVRRGRSTTDAAVAREWPRWWAANRDAVGDDPDLLHPGTPLSPPPADGAPASS